MAGLSELPVVEGIDTSSLLLAGTLFFLAVFALQILWIYRRGSSSGSASGAEAAETEAEASGEPMVVCPECSEPTEAEYRYCRNCASDTGRSYVGSRGDGDSNRSGML
jgi:hypothetical protein